MANVRYDREREVLKAFIRDYFKIEEHTLRVQVSESTPQQGNSYDCGVCTCVNLETLARTGSLDQLPLMYRLTDDGYITKESSEEVRQRIALEVMLGDILVK